MLRYNRWSTYEDTKSGAFVFDGSAVPIAKPQTGQGPASHLVYEGRAPVFITTSSDQIEALTAAGDGDSTA